jgi:hypothetical protein
MGRAFSSRNATKPDVHLYVAAITAAAGVAGAAIPAAAGPQVQVVPLTEKLAGAALLVV